MIGIKKNKSNFFNPPDLADVALAVIGNQIQAPRRGRVADVALATASWSSRTRAA